MPTSPLCEPMSYSPCREDEDVLHENLASHGLQVRCDVPGDGSCFFHAVLDQCDRLSVTNAELMTNGTNPEIISRAMQLRERAVDYFANLDKTDPLVTSISVPGVVSPGEVDMMKEYDTYATEWIIRATAQMLGRDIHIVNSIEGGVITKIDCLTPGEEDPLLLGHLVNGAHYLSLEKSEGRLLQEAIDRKPRVPLKRLTQAEVAQYGRGDYQYPRRDYTKLWRKSTEECQSRRDRFRQKTSGYETDSEDNASDCQGNAISAELTDRRIRAKGLREKTKNTRNTIRSDDDSTDCEGNSVESMTGSKKPSGVFENKTFQQKDTAISLQGDPRGSLFKSAWADDSSSDELQKVLHSSKDENKERSSNHGRGGRLLSVGKTKEEPHSPLSEDQTQRKHPKGKQSGRKRLDFNSEQKYVMKDIKLRQIEPKKTSSTGNTLVYQGNAVSAELPDHRIQAKDLREKKKNTRNTIRNHNDSTDGKSNTVESTRGSKKVSSLSVEKIFHQRENTAMSLEDDTRGSLFKSAWDDDSSSDELHKVLHSSEEEHKEISSNNGLGERLLSVGNPEGEPHSPSSKDQGIREKKRKKRSLIHSHHDFSDSDESTFESTTRGKKPSGLLEKKTSHQRDTAMSLQGDTRSNQYDFAWENDSSSDGLPDVLHMSYNADGERGNSNHQGRDEGTESWNVIKDTEQHQSEVKSARPADRGYDSPALPTGDSDREGKDCDPVVSDTSDETCINQEGQISISDLSNSQLNSNEQSFKNINEDIEGYDGFSDKSDGFHPPKDDGEGRSNHRGCDKDSDSESLIKDTELHHMNSKSGRPTDTGYDTRAFGFTHCDPVASDIADEICISEEGQMSRADFPDSEQISSDNEIIVISDDDSEDYEPVSSEVQRNEVPKDSGKVEERSINGYSEGQKYLHSDFKKSVDSKKDGNDNLDPETTPQFKEETAPTQTPEGNTNGTQVSLSHYSDHTLEGTRIRQESDPYDGAYSYQQHLDMMYGYDENYASDQMNSYGPDAESSDDGVILSHSKTRTVAVNEKVASASTDLQVSEVGPRVRCRNSSANKWPAATEETCMSAPPANEYFPSDSELSFLQDSQSDGMDDSAIDKFPGMPDSGDLLERYPDSQYPFERYEDAVPSFNAKGDLDKRNSSGLGGGSHCSSAKCFKTNKETASDSHVGNPSSKGQAEEQKSKSVIPGKTVTKDVLKPSRADHLLETMKESQNRLDSTPRKKSRQHPLQPPGNSSVNTFKRPIGLPKTSARSGEAESCVISSPVPGVPGDDLESTWHPQASVTTQESHTPQQKPTISTQHSTPSTSTGTETMEYFPSDSQLSFVQDSQSDSMDTDSGDILESYPDSQYAFERYDDAVRSFSANNDLDKKNSSGPRGGSHCSSVKCSKTNEETASDNQLGNPSSQGQAEEQKSKSISVMEGRTATKDVLKPSRADHLLETMKESQSRLDSTPRKKSRQHPIQPPGNSPVNTFKMPIGTACIGTEISSGCPKAPAHIDQPESPVLGVHGDDLETTGHPQAAVIPQETRTPQQKPGASAQRATPTLTRTETMVHASKDLPDIRTKRLLCGNNSGMRLPATAVKETSESVPQPSSKQCSELRLDDITGCILSWKTNWLQSNGESKENEVERTQLIEPLGLSPELTESKASYSDTASYRRASLCFLLMEIWAKISCSQQNVNCTCIWRQSEKESKQHETIEVEYTAESCHHTFTEDDLVLVDMTTVSGCRHRSQFGLVVGTHQTETGCGKVRHVRLAFHKHAIIPSSTRLVIIASLHHELNQARALLYQKNPLLRHIATLEELDVFRNEDQQITAKSTVKEELEVIRLFDGPTGTGKTSRLRNLIENEISRVRNKRRKLLVCAPSHKALDHLLRKVWKTLRGEKRDNQQENCVGGVYIVRVGDTHHADEQLSPFFISHLMAKMRKKQRNYDKLSDDELQMKILEQAEVIGCTLKACGSKIMRSSMRNVTAVFVDDVGHCTETEVLLALQNRSRRLFVAGDKRQGIVTIRSQMASRLGWNWSLLQRVVQKLPEELIRSFDSQFRMKGAIASFPSNFFYQGSMKTDSNKLPPAWKDYKLRPYMVFHVSDCMESDNSRYMNSCWRSLVEDAEKRQLVFLTSRASYSHVARQCKVKPFHVESPKPSLVKPPLMYSEQPAANQTVVRSPALPSAGAPATIRESSLIREPSHAKEPLPNLRQGSGGHENTAAPTSRSLRQAEKSCENPVDSASGASHVKGGSIHTMEESSERAERPVVPPCTRQSSLVDPRTVSAASHPTLSNRKRHMSADEVKGTSKKRVRFSDEPDVTACATKASRVQSASTSGKNETSGMSSSGMSGDMHGHYQFSATAERGRLNSRSTHEGTGQRHTERQDFGKRDGPNREYSKNESRHHFGREHGNTAPPASRELDSGERHLGGASCGTSRSGQDAAALSSYGRRHSYGAGSSPIYPKTSSEQVKTSFQSFESNGSMIDKHRRRQSTGSSHFERTNRGRQGFQNREYAGQEDRVHCGREHEVPAPNAPRNQAPREGSFEAPCTPNARTWQRGGRGRDTRQQYRGREHATLAANSSRHQGSGERNLGRTRGHPETVQFPSYQEWRRKSLNQQASKPGEMNPSLAHSHSVQKQFGSKSTELIQPQHSLRRRHRSNEMKDKQMDFQN
ncbi:uncharacterized protein [Diadema setosum]|uniref:uncharacterized protein n=1 Tax=Diadema setosum TaxID=31175 RepID=UPI003B3AA575